RSRRSHTSSILWTPGEAIPQSEPGTLEHFLTERYWLFTIRRGRVMGGRIDHRTWSLRRASISRLDDTLVRAAGIHVSGEPFAWHSDTLEVKGWNLVDMSRVR